MGRRGSPRKLGIEGEELPKVTYRLLEPERYVGTRCLVVGGGDSAIEAAVALGEAQGRITRGKELCLFGVGSGLGCVVMSVSW